MPMVGIIIVLFIYITYKGACALINTPRWKDTLVKGGGRVVHANIILVWSSFDGAGHFEGVYCFAWVLNIEPGFEFVGRRYIDFF